MRTFIAMARIRSAVLVECARKIFRQKTIFINVCVCVPILQHEIQVIGRFNCCSSIIRDLMCVCAVFFQMLRFPFGQIKSIPFSLLIFLSTAAAAVAVVFLLVLIHFTYLKSHKLAHTIIKTIYRLGLGLMCACLHFCTIYFLAWLHRSCRNLI